MTPSAALTERRTIRVKLDDYQDSYWIKQIPGRTWMSDGRCWEIPGTSEAVSDLTRMLPATVVDERVHSHIDGMQQWRTLVGYARAGAYDDLWTPELMRATPFDHQRRALSVGVNILAESNAYALWHDMGLGKSLTALALLTHLAQSGVAQTALVVCPSSVIGVWSGEAAKFCTHPVRVIELIGAVPKRVKKIQTAEPFDGLTIFVTNYEILWRPKMLAALCKIDIDVMIADEAHRLKNSSSEQAKAARKIAERSIRIALTGTPTGNNLTDWFGMYRWLDPSVFGTSFTAFKARYFNQVALGSTGVTMVTSPIEEMLPDLQAKAHSLAHACSKDDALDLQAPVDIERTCDLEPSALKAYNEMKHEALTMLSSEQITGSGDAVSIGDNVMTRLLRMRQITGGFLGTDKGIADVSTAKLKLCQEVVADTLAQEDKVIIFAVFTPEIDALAVMCRKLGHVFGVIDGRVKSDIRTKLIDKFQTDKKMRIIIIQTAAGGAGITLTAAHTSIFYSFGPAVIEYEQARGRTDRIGQPNACNYIHLLAARTFDKARLTALREHKDMSRMSTYEFKQLLNQENHT